MYIPDASSRHSVLLRENYDLFIFNDLSQEHKGHKMGFWDGFLYHCEPLKISLVASNRNIRVFTIDGKKWGIYLFANNEDAVDLIRSSSLMLSGFCWITDDYKDYRTNFFAQVLSMMGRFGLEVLTNCEIDPLKWGGITMNCRQYSVMHSVEKPEGFDNARYFLIERDIS